MILEPNSHARLPDEYDPDRIDQLLGGKFVFIADPSVHENWTFYDTYDWRLSNRSLVLRYVGQELILEHLSSGESWPGPIGHSPPEFAWDLPESLLRKRLESIVKMRALRPLANVSTKSTVYRILNDDEKTVARLVTTEVRAADDEIEPILATYVSLRPVRGYPKYSRKLAKRLARIPKVQSLIQDLYIAALDQAGQKPGSYSSKFNLRLKPTKRSDAATKEILRHSPYPVSSEPDQGCVSRRRDRALQGIVQNSGKTNERSAGSRCLPIIRSRVSGQVA
jgi:hypothetical protein